MNYKQITNFVELEVYLKNIELLKYYESLKLSSVKSISIETKFSDEVKLKSGISKLGGNPCFPFEFKWPRNKNGEALAFLAQINLSDLQEYSFLMDFPKQGFMLFFFNTQVATYPLNLFHENKNVQVLFLDEKVDNLNEVTPPLIENDDIAECDIFNECKIEFNEILSFPPSFSELVSDDDYEKYWTGLISLDFSISKIFGYPNIVQTEMEEKCKSIYKEVFKNNLNNNKWILLLQLDSEKSADMSWGDNGRLFFWIHEDDLKKRRFDRVISIMQSY